MLGIALGPHAFTAVIATAKSVITKIVKASSIAAATEVTVDEVSEARRATWLAMAEAEAEQQRDASVCLAGARATAVPCHAASNRLSTEPSTEAFTSITADAATKTTTMMTLLASPFAATPTLEAGGLPSSLAASSQHPKEQQQQVPCTPVGGCPPASFSLTATATSAWAVVTAKKFVVVAVADAEEGRRQVEAILGNRS